MTPTERQQCGIFIGQVLMHVLDVDPGCCLEVARCDDTIAIAIRSTARGWRSVSLQLPDILAITETPDRVARELLG